MTKIVKIKEIGNFSIFKNFHWDQNFDIENKKTYDFKDINIFYGRNYSGKTSLSKIIRSLEKQHTPPKYDNPSFKIELSDNSIISQNSLSTFTHPIHVYNSDFVKENLKFIHDENANIESFSVTLGGDNQQILDRIHELNAELGLNEENIKSGVFLDIQNKENEVKNATEDHKSKERDLEKLLTDKATRNSDSVKNQHSLFGDINYNVTKLKNEIAEVQSSNFQILTDDQLITKKALISQNELPNPPELSTYNLNFSQLVEVTTKILKTVVGGSNKIGELQNNPSLNSWVQTGHTLHKDRTHCAFCTNEISAKRHQELAQHFDLETQNLQTRIKKGIEHLTNLIDGEHFKINFNIDHYYQQYHTELLPLKVELTTILEKQKEVLKQLKTLLANKNGHLFTSLETSYPSDHTDEIKKLIEKIEEIRTQCILQTDLLTNQQKEAKKDLRLNHVYHFLQDINYTQQNLDINLALQAIEPLKMALSTLLTRKTEITVEIKNEEDKLKSEGEACKRIKAILNHDLGHQTLSLEPIEINTTNGKEIKFEIQRNGTKAHNLSEGEQSLISFCYFLAKIQDDLDKGNKPIIWIDDPISSLDSNHIFFIFSLIEEKICKDKKYSQLFISTHNLEFLKYLRRITGAEQDRSIGVVKEENRKASYYLIQRHDNFSTIKEMPLYFSKFLTEFNFLFDQIYKCATVNQIDDSNFHIFYNFGNNARKFLEIYTFYKFPSSKYQLDTQLKAFWGEQIYKTLTDRIHNEYSHMTGVLERGEIISEQPEMQKSAKAIISKVQQEDPAQYNALLESISNPN